MRKTGVIVCNSFKFYLFEQDEELNKLLGRCYLCNKHIVSFDEHFNTNNLRVAPTHAPVWLELFPIKFINFICLLVQPNQIVQ